jgi:hypothetical protein
MSFYNINGVVIEITFMDLKQTPPLMKKMHVGLSMVIDTPRDFCHKLNAPNS